VWSSDRSLRRTADASEHDRLASTIKGTEGEIAQLEDQRDIQNERLKLSESFVSTGAKLIASGALPAMELKRREQAALEQKQNVVSPRSADHRATHPIDHTQHTLEQLPIVAAERIAYW